MTLACVPQVGPFSWVIDDGLGPDDPPGARAATYTQHEATSKPSSWITNRTAALSLPRIPLFSYLRLFLSITTLLLLVSSNWLPKSL